MMKICSNCRAPRELSDFFVQNQNTGRLHAQCKSCYQEYRTTYAAAHYKKYGDAYRDRAKLRRARIKKVLQEEMIKYLRDKKCVICDEADPRVLDFDHLQPELKSFGISMAITRGLSWDKIICEIQKCRILCANCHRKHTATQQSWYRNNKFISK